jgi:hypothetical protein
MTLQSAVGRNFFGLVTHSSLVIKVRKVALRVDRTCFEVLDSSTNAQPILKPLANNNGRINGEAIQPSGLTRGNFLDSLINLILCDWSHKGFILISGDEGGDMLSDSFDGRCSIKKRI